MSVAPSEAVVVQRLRRTESIVNVISVWVNAWLGSGLGGALAGAILGVVAGGDTVGGGFAGGAVALTLGIPLYAFFALVSWTFSIGRYRVVSISLASLLLGLPPCVLGMDWHWILCGVPVTLGGMLGYVLCCNRYGIEIWPGRVGNLEPWQFTLGSLFWRMTVWAIVLGLVSLVATWLFGPFTPGPPDPRPFFSETTGLAWPSEAAQVHFEVGNRAFNGDGADMLTFVVPLNEVQRLLAGPPPWNASVWQSGPMDPSITSYAESALKLDTRPPRADLPVPDYRVASALDRPMPPSLSRQPLLARHVRYVARPRGPDRLPWHNGEVLIIDPQSGQLWLLSWDF